MEVMEVMKVMMAMEDTCATVEVHLILLNALHGLSPTRDTRPAGRVLGGTVFQKLADRVGSDQKMLGLSRVQWVGRVRRF